MHHQYPRTPLLAKLGYLLLLLAAIVLSYPIVVDIYHQGMTDEKPVVSAASLPLVSTADEYFDAQTPIKDEPRPSLDSELNAESSLIADQQHSVMKPVIGDSAAFPATAKTDSRVSAPENEVDLEAMMIPELGPQKVRLSEPTQALSVTAPIVQKSARHDAMVTPGNFTYLGAFRLPHVDGQKSRFAYGGHAITFCPTGDQDGRSDGFPGSLYMVGHKQHELVAEISIPKPVISAGKNMDDLSVATVVQPFADITVGLRQQLTAGSSEPFQFGGMQYLNGRLHWTLLKYYNVSGVDYLSHGFSSADLSRPSMSGMWHLGPRHSGESVWHSYKHAGYVADIPQKIADQYFQGRSLMSGLQISTGLQYSSQGPALYAYAPPDGDEPSGSNLEATPLLWYSMGHPISQHHYADLWTGAAWVTVGGKHAVVIAGRKALGPVYYGDARPTDCYPDKGYHGSSYEVQMLFYAPAHLLQAAKSRVAHVEPWFRWNGSSEGGGIDRFMFQECGREVGGLAYDRQNNLLYLSEMNAGLTSDNEWESLPVIHVFRLSDS